MVVIKGKLERKKAEAVFEKEEQRRKFLEKLGFVQMMFDFFAAPVT